jgi:SEC-C motif-containing protein
MDNTSTLCYCASVAPFSDCCQPLFNGSQQAKTAEQLMRSRFSAFCTANIDYLIASHHPSKRQADDHQNLAATTEHCHWLKLDIISTEAGSAKHNQGKVEFIAYYLDTEPSDKEHADTNNVPARLAQLHEQSRFIKQEGRWYYLDGIIQTSPASIKWPRNESCYCGSGHKYKRCCAR